MRDAQLLHNKSALAVGLGAAGLVLLCGPAGCFEDGADQNEPPAVMALSLVAEGLNSPLALCEPADGSGRLLVAQQNGRVSVIDADGRLLDAAFLDVTDRMVNLSPLFDERGLLGLALHPEYAANGRLFVLYIAPRLPEDEPGFDSRLRVSEFKVDPDDPNRADAESEVVLLEVVEPQSRHNAGQLAFGLDGRLYVATGDGGGAGDQGPGHTPGLGNAQDRGNLLGAILRFDADTPGALRIPPDNPFVGEPGVREEIFAYGLRNPYRFSFDAADGRLFCGDVGQGAFEEVNLVQSGGNYGWNIKEGSECFDADGCPSTGADGRALIDPILQYGHRRGDGEQPAGLSVIGGFVYRGQDIPELTGRYVFGDWSSSTFFGDGQLFVAEQSGDRWTFQAAAVAGFDDGRLQRFILGFGQGLDGELYVLTSRSTGPRGDSGEVWKLTSP